MAISLDQITRNSGIDPLVEPINCTVDYSGASASPIDLTFGGFGGTSLASGSPPSGSLTADIPISAASINSAGAGGVSGWGVGKFGVEGDGVQVALMPFEPDMNTIVDISAVEKSFGPPAYSDIASLVGGGVISTPYDYWTDGVTRSLTRAGLSRWTMAAPFTSFEWDFGDGATSTSATPTHTYTASGSYTVALTLDYAPLIVPSGTPGRSGATTITLTSTIDIQAYGWHVGRVGVG